jgi:hypothetical protein
VDRVRLAKLDEEAVKIQPLLISGVSNEGPKTGSVVEAGARVKVSVAKRDLSEIPVVGRDGSECRCDPSWVA